MFLEVSWFACGVIAALIGQRKGEGVLALLFGILLGPLGLLLVIFSKGDRKECPYCRELINQKATRCPHCQKEIEDN